MPRIKAVITDFIGTLTNARLYTMEASTMKLHAALCEAGFETNWQEFLDAYTKAHEKYRLVRYGDLREVTNAIWVSEALRNLGYDVKAEDSRMKAALNVFFQDYVDSLEKRPYSENLLRKVKEKCRLGLISNFTYAPVVYGSLRKLGLSKYFNVVVVSGECGWRKPHRKIFDDALNRMQVKADETIFIGDSPTEDIKGARDAGMITIFVRSQFYCLADLRASKENPDAVAEDLKKVYEIFTKIAGR